MCPFLLDEHYFFRYFSVRSILVKPFFDAAPAAIITGVDINRAAGFISWKMSFINDWLFLY